jgi:hypothetical protein
MININLIIFLNCVIIYINHFIVQVILCSILLFNSCELIFRLVIFKLNNKNITQNKLNHKVVTINNITFKFHNKVSILSTYNIYQKNL